LEFDLQQWIEAHGFAVNSVEIIRDRLTGQPRGFGFASLRDAAKVKHAIAELNGKRMNGRPLTVNEAVPLRTEKIA
jgi:RNA recognition motif-containing protein